MKEDKKVNSEIIDEEKQNSLQKTKNSYFNWKFFGKDKDQRKYV